MDILSITLVGVGLAMDCFAVSTTQGLHEKKWNPKALWMAILFGLFQGGMPLIGFYAGTFWTEFFRNFSPWVALALLGWIGGKMIWESTHRKEDKRVVRKVDWSTWRLLSLAIATSIDALATGVIFIPFPESLWLGIGIIALCSLLFAMIGYLIGVGMGTKFRLNAELIGGLILIGIGLKIFVEGKGWEILS